MIAKMLSKQTKKRKIEEENRSFNEKWKLNYFFHSCERQSRLSFMLGFSIRVKEYNIKRHYETKHEANYKNIQDQMRKDKFNELEKSLKQQQNKCI